MSSSVPYLEYRNQIYMFTVPVNGCRTKNSLHIKVSRNHISPIMLSYIVLFYNDKIV